MRFIRLIVVFLLILVLLSHFNFCNERQFGGHRNKPIENFTDFREARMKLPEKQDSLCLVVVGDIMLSRYVAKKIKEYNDPGYPFAEVKWFLQNGDITFGNLEGPITSGREIKLWDMILRIDSDVALALKDAGFDILSLANNHLPDFGEQGILDTINHLNKVGIHCTGAGKKAEEAFSSSYMEVNGIKLAFLAFSDPVLVRDNYIADDTPGISVLDDEMVTAAVKDAANNADFTIVYMHVGNEYEFEPNDTQVHFAHLAIDNGADLVVGSHPHVIQKVEQYKGKYIIYSLGNFIFDQLWSEDTREGVAAKIYINRNKVEKMEFLPIYINDEARPVALSGQNGQKVLEKLELELDVEIVPVWDNEKNVFTTREQYIFQPNISRFSGDIPEYRLFQKRYFDLDEDGVLEEFTLNDGIVTVKKHSDIIWKSQDNWWVDYFFLGDANNDGVVEFNLLVWKEGSFGRYKPFWISEDEEDTSVKNHLFIFKMENGSIKPVWQSSNLDYPNYHAALVDLNNDGKNELLVTEGSYDDSTRRKITLWEWKDWGFYQIELE